MSYFITFDSFIVSILRSSRNSNKPEKKTHITLVYEGHARITENKKIRCRDEKSFYADIYPSFQIRF